MAYKTSYPESISVNVINEITSGNGIDIDSVNLKDGTINLPLSNFNLGGANSLWQNSSGVLFRGAVNLEKQGDVVGAVSSTDNSVVRFDSTTGKIIQNTSGFTCDDNFNVKIGGTTLDVDRTFHLQGRKDISLFLEADTENNSGNEQDNPQIIITQDGNNIFSSLGLEHDESATGRKNRFVIKLAKDIIEPDINDIIFKTGGIYTNPGTGIIPTLTSDAIEAMTIRGDNQFIEINETLGVDTINEFTPAAGVTIEQTKLEDGGIDFTTKASNPGGANTLWQNTAGTLFRGSVDLEKQGDLVGAVSSSDNGIARFDGITGKIIQNTTGFTCDDNFNVKIGDITSDVDRTLHIQGKQSASIFIEADTNNNGETDNPQIVITQDGGRGYVALGLTLDNRFVFNVASDTPTSGGKNHDLLFTTGGITPDAPFVGIKTRTYLEDPIDTLLLRAVDQHVLIYETLEVDTINELTAAAGVTIEETNLKDGSLNFTTKASNPGGANTLWQRTDGSLFRGSVPLENIAAELAFYNNTPYQLSLPVLNDNYQIQPAATFTTSSTLFTNTTAGRINYVGTIARTFIVFVSLGAYVDTAPTELYLYNIGVNGVPTINATIREELKDSVIDNATFHKLLTLNPNDYVNIFAQRRGTNTILRFYNYHVLIKSV